MYWILAAVALIAVVAAARRIARRLQELRVAEADRRRRVAAHLDQRERARRVLAGEAEPLPAAPLALKAGERAHHLAPAASLAPEDDGFRRQSRGQLLVTNRAVYFLAGGQVLQRIPVHNIERVDVPFANVVALVSFQDTLTREETRVWFEVAEPLILAAHVSRFTGFELILS